MTGLKIEVWTYRPSKDRSSPISMLQLQSAAEVLILLWLTQSCFNSPYEM